MVPVECIVKCESDLETLVATKRNQTADFDSQMLAFNKYNLKIEVQSELPISDYVMITHTNGNKEKSPTTFGCHQDTESSAFSQNCKSGMRDSPSPTVSEICKRNFEQPNYSEDSDYINLDQQPNSSSEENLGDALSISDNEILFFPQDSLNHLPNLKRLVYLCCSLN